jgi:hypothetical protein
VGIKEVIRAKNYCKIDQGEFEEWKVVIPAFL